MQTFFGMWKKSQVLPGKGTMGTASDILLKANETFKRFLMKDSWLVYLIAGFLIICCLLYYLYDRQRHLNSRRRRQELQRASERVPQRRRPGAAHRDHEIFRNVLQTVRQYIEPKTKSKNTKYRPYILKKTRSGRIYGHYSEQDDVNEQ